MFDDPHANHLRWDDWFIFNYGGQDEQQSQYPQTTSHNMTLEDIVNELTNSFLKLIQKETQAEMLRMTTKSLSWKAQCKNSIVLYQSNPFAIPLWQSFMRRCIQIVMRSLWASYRVKQICEIKEEDELYSKEIQVIEFEVAKNRFVIPYGISFI